MPTKRTLWPSRTGLVVVSLMFAPRKPLQPDAGDSMFVSKFEIGTAAGRRASRPVHRAHRSGNAGRAQASGRNVEHDSSVDLTGPQIGKDAVDVLQLGAVDVRPHLPLRNEGQGLREVLAGADDRAPDGDSLQDHVEDRHGEVTGGQANEAHRSLAPL